jgi:hypothetical protein
MATAVWLIFYKAAILDASKPLLTLKLALSIISGIAVYIGVLKAYAKEEAEMFIGWISRRK